ncbi:hypothetical protein LV716_07835 [Flagellimonas sp. HMM57]|uniref:hypothetical protein n=1 Tax=unclassified Flagellimonas TaxID=2644544 RepID=UPI0013D35B32|nr:MULTISPECIES: hypothetical protein [unclassified Flagellimonas]UII77668.1 hypothetical protein LV716_07835 [Flagellimonas sp. HMM57]
MLREYIQHIFLLGILACHFSIFAQSGTVVYSEDFTNGANGWMPFGPNGASGLFKAVEGKLKVSLESGDIYGAYYSSADFSGHFEVEVDFLEDSGVALGLIKSTNGKPSSDDYAMITITRNNDGIIEIKLVDEQEGKKDVFDNTGLAKRARYTHLLTGQEYSVPYTKTAKKLRILRHDGEKFLHFYYAVEKQVDGVVYQDWMELAPSKEWGDLSQPYFIGVFSLDETVHVDSIKVTQRPIKDQKDTETGFAVTKRPFTWSGYTAPALVVTFGDKFPFAKDDHKFVFWELMNNVPAWHLNNTSLFTYGFVETWNGGNPGCHEPMSDRLRAYTNLEIVKDNAVRKIIKWSYKLVDPDYKHPDNGKGKQLPEVTEYYSIYADGSIIRKIQYAPKLDTNFRNWHELMEMMVIAGENNRPAKLLEYPSLTFYEQGKAPEQYNNESDRKFRNDSQRLGATTMIAHVKGAPDLFNSFSDDVRVPWTYSGCPLNYEITWHDRKNNFGHWPVNKEPYQHPFKSGSTWPEHIAHTSLVGMGVYLGQDWEDNFLVAKNGRKYRQWLSLLGMSDEREGSIAKEKTDSWLYPGTIKVLGASCSFTGYSHENKYFEFENKAKASQCNFRITPKTKLINPIFKINKWNNSNVHVHINDKPLPSSDFITTLNKHGDLLLIVLKTYENDVRVKVFSTILK